MSTRFRTYFSAIVALGLGVGGCSAGGEPAALPGGEAGIGGAAGVAGGGTGGPIIGPGGMTGVRDPMDTRDLPTRKRMCDSSGQNCTCLRLALLGTLDSAAANKDTQPFVDWLNTNSGGTATVTMVTTKPTLDAAYLGNFDVLVVANVNSWSFSEAEKNAVRTWLLETGGGIVSLTGFDSTAGEPAQTSQLIGVAGLSYTPTRTAENGQSSPVYFEGGTTDLKQCLSWTGDVNGGSIITTPIPFTPQTGSMEKLTFELDYVGAFIGWAVSGPAGATVIATDPISGQPIATALELEGKGRVLAFGDEWVVFRNQWEPAGSPHNMQMDMYNMCWHSDGAGGGYFHSVKSLYQTKQFWYNAVSYVAPPNECGFTITDPDVVVR